MNNQEIGFKRDELERTIAQLIRDFQRDTGCHVTGLDEVKSLIGIRITIGRIEEGQ